MKEYQSDVIYQLKERAKELNCLYEVQEILSNKSKSVEYIFINVLKVIPSGFQFPNICAARIRYENFLVKTDNFKTSEWKLEANIKFQENIVGSLEIYYLRERPIVDEGPFLKEERRLIDAVSDLIGSYFFFKQLKTVFDSDKEYPKVQKSEWGIVLEMLRKTNPKLLMRISKKMVNYLMWKGIREAEHLYEFFSPGGNKDSGDYFKETNYPYKAKSDMDSMEIISKVIEMSNIYLSEDEVLDNISRWIKEDQSGFMVHILGNLGSTFEEISSVIDRFHFLKKQGLELSEIRRNHLKVTLIRRLLSDDTQFVNNAKKFLKIDDFHELLNSTIHPVNSHGKYGGKSAGLFVSKYMLQRSKLSNEHSQSIKLPKTWYITSDGILSLIKYNQLEDVAEQKYKTIEEVRKEYPYVSHIFKNATIPPEISKDLYSMLDDFGEVPLVVRSTSLLEDKPNSIFAGKYKSLFISNQGTKSERMEELTNAITEVYASTFGPDPIEYRIERGLIDYNEEMGLMIQEVIGQKIGKYYLPAFGGVAFSQNNYRWSSRIQLEDGLLRLVPGLGTRAVDRLSDDYPVLIAPGKPNLRVNASTEELVRYSPKNIDIIDLEKRSFSSMSITKLVRELGNNFPYVNHVFSKISESYLQDIRPIGNDFSKDSHVVTFNSLIKNTDFIKEIRIAMEILEAEFEFPVDLEFAHDGKDLYLLQCRKQSHGKIRKPGEIPKNIDEDKVLFTAEKHITNGTLSNITHVVYVDPDNYNKVSDRITLKSVGEVVGKLNEVLPKRQFILMGPGRWGSRGDIKLGVSVTYSQISNTSMLIEIAKKKKDYVPELSFGTHFFQDLVEANILYLPLYPDDEGIIFNTEFFKNSPNILSKLFDEFSDLKDIVKVIDLSAIGEGKSMTIAMNEDNNEAEAYISDELIGTEIDDFIQEAPTKKYKKVNVDFHWKWRLRIAEQIGGKLDPEKYGVEQFYVFGSTKNGTAGPESDIDILIHFKGNEKQKEDLMTWLNGWSLSLDYINYLRTGFRLGGMLDIHIVTDEDIENRTSFAVKIGAVTDPARPIPLGELIKK